MCSTSPPLSPDSVITTQVREALAHWPVASQSDTLCRELAAIHRSDLTLLCSSFELRELRLVPTPRRFHGAWREKAESLKTRTRRPFCREIQPSRATRYGQLPLAGY